MREKLTSVYLHQGNTPAHTSAVAMATIHECRFQMIEQSSYLPGSEMPGCIRVFKQALYQPLGHPSE